MIIQANRLTNQDKVRYIGFFTFAIVSCMPLLTVTIAGRGLLLYLSLLLLCGFVLRLYSKHFILEISIPLLMYLLFSIYQIVSYLWCPSFSVSSCIELIKCVLLIICVSTYEPNASEKRLIRIGTLIASAVICYNISVTNAGYALLNGRVSVIIFGVFQDPNYVCIMLLPSIAVLVDNMLNTERKLFLRFFSLVYIIVILSTILKTGSRGGLIASFVLIVSYIIYKYQLSIKMILVFLVVLLVAYIGFPYLLLLLPENVAARFSLAEIGRTGATGRTDIWRNAFKAFFDNPQYWLLGFGTGSSNAVIQSATHNFLIQLMLENGIMGLVLFGNFVISIINNVTTKNKNEKAFAMSLLLAAIAVSMGVSTTTNEYFWITLALCIIL